MSNSTTIVDVRRSDVDDPLTVDLSVVVPIVSTVVITTYTQIMDNYMYYLLSAHTLIYNFYTYSEVDSRNYRNSVNIAT